MPVTPSSNKLLRPLREMNHVAVPALLVLFIGSLASTPLNALPSQQQEPATREGSAEERRQRMEERRKERAEAAAELRERRSDPEFLKQSAWWNDEQNVEKFNLTAEQRKNADQALATFVTRRDEAASTTREAQTAFFEALAAGSPDVKTKKDQMIEAMTAANADLRIAVIGALTDDQRTKLQSEKPRLLRSNWADPRGGRGNRRLNRQRGPASNN